MVPIKIALQEARMSDLRTELESTTDHVEIGLTAVAATVFPHKVLQIMKLWMKHQMFKPIMELTAQQEMAATINRLNNALPLLPGSSELSKFSESQVIELLEWLLLPSWQAKFNLDGYIPTLGSKIVRLI